MDIELWRKKKKQLKLTFDDLAKLTNLSSRTLKAIFSGERQNPTNFTIEAIEKALQIENETNFSDVNDKEKVLLKHFRKLDCKMQDYFIDVIKKYPKN